MKGNKVVFLKNWKYVHFIRKHFLSNLKDQFVFGVGPILSQTETEEKTIFPNFFFTQSV